MPDGTLRSRFTHNVPTSVVTETELRTHLSGVDTPLLLVCAVHVTGDVSLLDQFADKVGSPRSSIRGWVQAPVDAAVAQAHAELTDILCCALTQPHQAPYLRPTDLDLVSRMADVAIGMHLDATVPSDVSGAVRLRAGPARDPAHVAATGDAEPGDHRIRDDRPGRGGQGRRPGLRVRGLRDGGRHRRSVVVAELSRGRRRHSVRVLLAVLGDHPRLEQVLPARRGVPGLPDRARQEVRADRPAAVQLRGHPDGVARRRTGLGAHDRRYRRAHHPHGPGGRGHHRRWPLQPTEVPRRPRTRELRRVPRCTPHAGRTSISLASGSP